MHRDIKSKNNMSKLLNFFQEVIKNVFQITRMAGKKIKNNNLKAVTFSFAHKEAYWILFNWISKKNISEHQRSS